MCSRNPEMSVNLVRAFNRSQAAVRRMGFGGGKKDQ